MKKAAVIGGGLAGFSAAVHLSEAGIPTDIFESSPKPGGRAYSFKDPQTGGIIDNGQHIMMGCYGSTLEFLRMIGASDKINIQSRLEVNFADRTGEVFSLKAGSLPYPLSLLQAVLRYEAFSWKDKAAVVRFFSELLFTNPADLDGLSAAAWLKESRQTERAISALWEIVAVGALNCSMEKAAAPVFASILKQMFLKGDKAARLILPDTGLSQMYCRQATNFIESRGGNVFLSAPVKGVITEKGRVCGLKLRGREAGGYDFFISAVPPQALSRIIPGFRGKEGELSDYKYSSILSLHFRLSRNVFGESFYGLIGSEVHWVFNHDSFVTIVISNADKYLDMPAKGIADMVIHELETYFPLFRGSDIISHRVIFEKRATIIPDAEFIKGRQQTLTGYSNFFLAGDWIDTGLPATIESAVKSGRMAAEEVKKRL